VAAHATVLPESEFAALVDAAAANPARHAELSELLREDHFFYRQRGTAAVIRMRGWVLLALARIGVADAELLYVLEELDTGIDAYVVAAAARALRSYPAPSPAFAPFVVRAINAVRYHDDPVSFAHYGEYATSGSSTSPVRELLATLAWLGPEAREVLPQVESLLAVHGGLPKKLHEDVEKAIQAIRTGNQQQHGPDSCCILPDGLKKVFSFTAASRQESKPVEEAVFQDQNGESLTFKEFFYGHPSIVVFFYTRCDNPLKCSLTITRLARMQKLLESRGLAEIICTAAITYDPGFDLPDRLRSYGESRGMRFDGRHRMLRTMEDFAGLRDHFKLGVNFVESLVNRHKVEAYLLDAQGRIDSCFERVHWDEEQLAARSIALLEEAGKPDTPPDPNTKSHRHAAAHALGVFAAVALAFFPKCPLCWASYLSVFGIAGLEQVPYSPWLQPFFVAVMFINLATVWFRRRSTAGTIALWLVATGTGAILVFQLAFGWKSAAICGLLLTMAGSFLSARGAKTARIIPQHLKDT
jgi:protein SCO1/2